MASIKVAKREGKGKYRAFELRKAGRIPGVVYGKGIRENIDISLDLKEFLAILKANERIVDLDIDGDVVSVLIKAVQHGTYDHEILHADFRAVSADETIEVEVEIELRGDAPGVAAGGLLEQNLHRVGIRCQPRNIPEKVVVDVSGVNLGDILYADDLPRLDGVEYQYHGNPSVLSCHLPRGEEESAAEPGAVPAAPEVIGEKEREAKAKDKE